MRTVLLVIAVSVVTGCGGRKTPAETAAHRPSASRVVLRAFVLQPRGLIFWMHPTETRINVTTSAHVDICEIGTTFSHYWVGGCRHLRSGSLSLPTSGGATHIGFRVRPSSGHPVRVPVLVVQWHCVDHFFLLQRGRTRVGMPGHTLDC